MSNIDLKTLSRKLWTVPVSTKDMEFINAGTQLRIADALESIDRGLKADSLQVSNLCSTIRKLETKNRKLRAELSGKK